MNENEETFNRIKQSVSSASYEAIRGDILALAAKLEKENSPSSKKLLERVKEFNYPALVKLDAQYDRRLVKAGTRVYKEPEYKEKYDGHPVTDVPKIFGNFIFSVAKGIGDTVVNKGRNTKQIEEDMNNYRPGVNKVKVSEGGYEETPAVYETVLVSAAHYQKLRINPYNGTKEVIEKIPLN